MPGKTGRWRSTGRSQAGSVSAWQERRSKANEAYETGRWEESGPLWEAIFNDATEPREKVFAGRRAALSYRKSSRLTEARRVLRQLVVEYPEDAGTRRELARLQIASRTDQSPTEYWKRRQRFIYVQITREIAQRIASHANSVLDVGSNGTPILSWFPEVPVRVSVDLRVPYRAEGIESHQTDFLTWRPGRKFDVGLCLQVLEHVPDATAFARHLIDLCEVVIVSVPYRWPEDASRYHVHDPVDEEKMKLWFGTDPNYSYRVAELHGQERLICVYDAKAEEAWRDVPEDRFRFRWSLAGADRLLADEGG